MILKHRHLIISANAEYSFETEEELKQWIVGLVKHLNMQMLIEPQVVYHDVEGNRGFTGICAITTSSVTLHNWTENLPHKTEIDIYSCKEFDLHEVLKKIQKDLKCTKIYYKYINRDNDLEEYAGGFLRR